MSWKDWDDWDNAKNKTNNENKTNENYTEDEIKFVSSISDEDLRPSFARLYEIINSAIKTMKNDLDKFEKLNDERFLSPIIFVTGLLFGFVCSTLLNIIQDFFLK